MGIVIVSHSGPLARAVVDLAREMAGTNVVLVAAGGIVGAEGALGTDAVQIAAAIEEAAKEGGALVLMDLGSAVLSAELALELLDPAVRARVLLCDAPLVEGAVAAAVAARLGRPLTDVADEARQGTAAKVAHLGAGPPAVASATAEAGAAAGDSALEARIVVRLPHGLHARPAARLVATVGTFDATVTVTNLTTGAGPANARSLTRLAVLGIEEGHELSVRATGPDAAPALAAVVAQAGSPSGEDAPTDAAPGPPSPGPAGG